MTKHERTDFRAFCQNATDAQLREIVRRERAAARGGSEYREQCAEIAEEVAEARGV
jgi:hypothetical protein